jgi:hypothetical protein
MDTDSKLVVGLRRVRLQCIQDAAVEVVERQVGVDHEI